MDVKDLAGPPRWAVYLILLGAYLTLRGYHSLDGDQAYRLPLLLHQQDPDLYAADPFVRSFEAFNPHRGYLTLLDMASRPLGLSAGLFGLFALTFALTALGMERLARAVWPDRGPWIGPLAMTLLLTAGAGNIGNNQLFEAMLLDRLLALAFGWVALSEFVGRPSRAVWTTPLLLGLAAWVHPSLGLQLAMLLTVGWFVLAALPRVGEVRLRQAALAVGLLGLALVPTVLGMAGQAQALLKGMDPAEFYAWTVQVQSPQHMRPGLWNLPKWLGFWSYLVLAGLSLWAQRREAKPARWRLTAVLVLLLVGLSLSWVAIEVMRDLRVTVFQPFRMATVTRGLALIVVASRVLDHWKSKTAEGRLRAALLVVGLSGDWSMSAATAIELAFVIAGRSGVAGRWVAGLAMLGVAAFYLSRHDTESGHWRLLAAAAIGAASVRLPSWPAIAWTPGRLIRVGMLAWAAPTLVLMISARNDLNLPRWVEGLIARWRFTERPTDDVERLALWCREATPPNARFVGPPGPKTFRLWSRRSLAFNRSGSPYHGEGLADWSARFRDHVTFEGDTAEFVNAYLSSRHELEQRFEALTPEELAALARRQGADHVLASAGLRVESNGPLERIHVEGRYAVYRVVDPFEG